MKPSFVHATIVALLLAVGTIAGCGDETFFEGSCSLCLNGVPVGPSADQVSCLAWGAEFGCVNIDLVNEGMCGDPAATCVASNCVRTPDCSVQ